MATLRDAQGVPAGPPAARISPWWLTGPVLLFGSNFLVALHSQPDQSNLVYQLSAIVATAVVDLILVGYVLLAVTRSRVEPREALALKPVPVVRAARLVAAVFVLLTVLDLITDPLLHAGQKQGIAPTHAPHGEHQWITLAVALVALVVIAPVSEELIFRGLCFATMGRYAIPGSAALFAIAHGLPVLLAPIFVAGLVLGWLRAHTGSLYPGIAVHMLLNAAALAAALAST
ncbi:MAG: lysostaphin resistance A-like protein [Gaiellales bacterium]